MSKHSGYGDIGKDGACKRKFGRPRAFFFWIQHFYSTTSKLVDKFDFQITRSLSQDVMDRYIHASFSYTTISYGSA